MEDVDIIMPIQSPLHCTPPQKYEKHEWKVGYELTLSELGSFDEDEHKSLHWGLMVGENVGWIIL